MLRQMRTAMPALSWLLALVLLMAAVPVHHHGPASVACAIEAPTPAGDVSVPAPCAACRLLHASALMPAPAPLPGSDLAPEPVAWSSSTLPEPSGGLSPAAPRGPPALI